jgi:hypothetical protein
MLPTAVTAAFGNRRTSSGTAQSGLVSDPASLASLGKAYNLSNTEKIELGKLINNREGELDALQKKFDELQRSDLILNH